MADDIKTGDTFGDFRVTGVTPLYEQNETAVMLSHGPTGLQWLHFIADDPVSMFPLLVFVLMMKYHVSNPVTRFFGKYSLHTYLMNRKISQATNSQDS